MATRTQKAAMKKKAEAEKAPEPEAPQLPAEAPSKAAKRAKATKSAKPKASQVAKAKAPKPAKGGMARKASQPQEEVVTLIPEPQRVSMMERFWHRLAVRAQRKEAAAHVREAEREEAERLAAEQAAEEAKQVAAREAAEEQRKAEASAREMARLAKEEEARLQAGAQQAQLAKQEAAREARRAKAAAARAAKEEAARVAAEKAAARKAARLAKKAEASAPAAVAEPEPAAAEPSDAPEPSEDAETQEDVVVELVEVELHEKAPGKAAAPPQHPEPTTQADAQAERFAAEMAARRSKPIEISDDEIPDAIPRLPVGRHGAPSGQAAAAKEVLQLDAAPPARIDTAPRGLSVPEQYLLLTLDDAWDERREKVRPQALGGALAGALLLELAMHGKLRVQRDRFQVTDAAVDDAAAAVAAKLARWSDLPSLQAMRELAKWIPQLLPAYKDRMAQRGLVEHRAWRHLGLFYRSQTALVDAEAQERLRNKLGRAIAGGGRPDAPTILALGLLEASGLFGLVVPEGAQQYNRKRLNGLLAGKDVMGYKVDDELKGLQEIAVRTILDNVRILTTQ